MNELAALLVPVLGYAAFYARQAILSRVTPKRLDTVFAIARSTVAAAEEIGTATGIKGADKYTVAADALVATAKRVGIKLKPTEVASFIHAAVDELHTVQKYGAQVQAEAA